MKKMTTRRIEERQRVIVEGAVTQFIAEIQGDPEKKVDLEPAVIRFIQGLRRELEALHSA